MKPEVHRPILVALAIGDGRVDPRPFAAERRQPIRHQRQQGREHQLVLGGVACRVLLPGLGVVLELQVGGGRMVAMPLHGAQHAGRLGREFDRSSPGMPAWFARVPLRDSGRMRRGPSLAGPRQPGLDVGHRQPLASGRNARRVQTERVEHRARLGGGSSAGPGAFG